MVIIDNSIISFANQLNNGILVSSFIDEKDDIILKGLIGYLKTVILKAEDVRLSNKISFGFEEKKKELNYIIKEELGI